MWIRIPKACGTGRSPTKMTKIHYYNIYVEVLGQTHGGSGVVVASVSVNAYEPRLVDSVCFHMLF